MTPRTPSPPSRAAAVSAVSVFRFLDAREFLRQAYLAERQRNRAFSQRYIAGAMAEKSSSFFQDILSGKSKLTPARILKFARLFKLSKPEIVHFENLVLYTQAESEDEKAHALDKLKAAGPSGGHTLLDAFHREYFSKWHYAAVRELLALCDFRGDYEALGKLLNPPLSAAEARAAVQLLVKLKLVRKDAQGGYRRVESVVLSGPKNVPAHMRPVLLGQLELARKALDAFPPGKRPFSYLTVSVSEASLEKIRGMITALRDNIFELVVKDEAVDRLYQLNLQLFPISETVKRSKK